MPVAEYIQARQPGRDMLNRPAKAFRVRFIVRAIQSVYCNEIVPRVLNSQELMKIEATRGCILSLQAVCG